MAECLFLSCLDMQTDCMSGITVRPIGHVEDEPEIRRIGTRDLFHGNKHAADSGQHGQSFQHVVSVSSESHPTTHHHPLDDGPGNDWTVFEQAVNTARTLSQRDGSALIHCTAGISRSSAIIATVLAAEESRRFNHALSIVWHAWSDATPYPAIRELR